MKTLIVKQKREDGIVKVWKVKPSQSPCTFGTARISHLNSIDDSLTPFEGVFQLNQDVWSYVDLNPSNINDHKSTKLNSESQLEFKKSKLSFEIIEKSYNHVESFKNFQSSENGKHEAQLFMLTYNDRFIRSQILELNQKFILDEVHPVVQIPVKKSSTWIDEKVDNYIIKQRTIKTDDISNINHFTTHNIIDEDSKKPLYFAISISLLIALMAFVLPKQKQEITTWQPKEAQRIIVDIESLKKRKVAKAQAVEIEKQEIQKQAGGGGKVSGLLKNLNVGRISKLVGKVSAGEAASKNIIVQNGIKAGSGPTGRALAAIGSDNKNGKDWSSEGNGLGLAVSTAGKAGGKSLAGMGGLQAGKTGDGGVGLIEDEAEVSGGLDRDIIAEHIKRQIGHILACYDRQLAAKKDLGGKVSVKFTISGNGSVETQNITETTMKDATVEGCILNRVAKWTFPAPNGGTKVIVTYPFLFKSTN